MGLSEQSIVDKIEVLADGQIQVRRADLVLRDDVEIGRTYHRHVLAPGQDLADQDARVVAIAKATWTPDVVTAHRERVKAEAEAAEAALAAAPPPAGGQPK